MITKPSSLLATTILFCCLTAGAGVNGPTMPSRPADSARLAVPVRVYDGGAFVGGLGLKDFELHTAGMAVAPDAVFLIRKGQVERREGAADVYPDLARRLTLLFQMSEYPNKIGEAIDYIFKEGLVPGDSLDIQTPVKNYQLSSEQLSTMSRATLAKDLTKTVRRDVVQGSVIYKSLLRELRSIVRLIAGVRDKEVDQTEGESDENSSIEMQLMHYRENLSKMEETRSLGVENLAAFAGKLRSQPGQKFVFYFYQREFRPEISNDTLNTLVMGNQDRPDIVAELQSVFQMYHRPITLDYSKLTRLYAHSMANLNFLYINKQPDHISGINMTEQSEDVFKAMSRIAEATGGLVDSSQNPAASIKTALQAAETYYILYFTPSAAAPPGTFMNIAVKVKGRDCKVLHPAGYFTKS